MRKLTQQQYELYDGTEYTKDMFLHVIKDAEDNWVIGEEEYEQNTMIEELKNLPFIEYNPIIPTPLNNIIK